jgi:hypothetical protein
LALYALCKIIACTSTASSLFARPHPPLTPYRHRQTARGPLFSLGEIKIDSPTLTAMKNPDLSCLFVPTVANWTFSIARPPTRRQLDEISSFPRIYGFSRSGSIFLKRAPAHFHVRCLPHLRALLLVLKPCHLTFFFNPFFRLFRRQGGAFITDNVANFSGLGESWKRISLLN